MKYGILVWAAVVILIIVGWIMNVVDLAAVVSDPLTGLTILRAIGVVVPPLGAVLGWLV